MDDSDSDEHHNVVKVNRYTDIERYSLDFFVKSDYAFLCILIRMRR